MEMRLRPTALPKHSHGIFAFIYLLCTDQNRLSITLRFKLVCTLIDSCVFVFFLLFYHYNCYNVQAAVFMTSVTTQNKEWNLFNATIAGQ